MRGEAARGGAAPRRVRGRFDPARGAPSLLLLLLVGAVCWQAAALFWRLVPAPELAAARQEAAVVRHKAAPPFDYRTIAAAHLFGQREQEHRAVQDMRHAPPTRLDLKLLGVVLTDTPGQRRAIITAPGHPERAYPPGAELPGGATLVEFHADRVILRRDGRFETLRIDIDALPADDLRIGPADVDPVGAGEGAERTLDLRGDPELSARLGQYRSLLMTDPVALSGLLRLAPETRHGALVGYRIREDSDLSTLGRFGLQAGDVVTAVNDVALDDPSAGVSLLRQLPAADQLHFKVLREDNLLSFYFQIDN